MRREKIMERKELRKTLPAYQIPQKIFFVESFPVNNGGKISKSDLESAYFDKS